MQDDVSQNLNVSFRDLHLLCFVQFQKEMQVGSLML